MRREIVKKTSSWKFPLLVQAKCSFSRIQGQSKHNFCYVPKYRNSYTFPSSSGFNKSNT
jgi:hypothetical protein